MCLSPRAVTADKVSRPGSGCMAALDAEKYLAELEDLKGSAEVEEAVNGVAKASM